MKRGLCKFHFVSEMRNWMSKEFRNLYRSAETAYGSLDFHGKGYITLDQFLNGIVVKNLLKKKYRNINESYYSNEDLTLFIQYYNLFPQTNRKEKI